MVRAFDSQMIDPGSIPHRDVFFLFFFYRVLLFLIEYETFWQMHNENYYNPSAQSGSRLPDCADGLDRLSASRFFYPSE